MKLAFCLFNYFPYGGLQRDFIRIARECLRHGHDIHVYTMSWQGERELGLTIHLVPVSGWTNASRCVSFAKAVQPMLEQGDYSVVVGFNKMPHLDLYFAADVCYQARIREQRSFFYRWLPRYRDYLALETAVFQKGQHCKIMLISPIQQQAFMRYYQTESDRFILLPPGIDRSRKAPANAEKIRRAMRQTMQVEADDHVVLMVGSGFKTKGLDRALLAVASLPEIVKDQTQFWVVGQDDPSRFTSLMAKFSLQENVRFLGGRDDVPALLLAADVLIHPAYHENTGTVLLEAMVAGLPVLTVDVCGYAHYIREADAGIVLTSPFTQTALDQALGAMLAMPADLKKWHENGLAFAEHADIYDMPERVVDIIEQEAKP